MSELDATYNFLYSFLSFSYSVRLSTVFLASKHVSLCVCFPVSAGEHAIVFTTSCVGIRCALDSIELHHLPRCPVLISLRSPRSRLLGYGCLLGIPESRDIFFGVPTWQRRPQFVSLLTCLIIVIMTSGFSISDLTARSCAL